MTQIIERIFFLLSGTAAPLTPPLIGAQDNIKLCPDDIKEGGLNNSNAFMYQTKTQVSANVFAVCSERYSRLESITKTFNIGNSFYWVWQTADT